MMAGDDFVFAGLIGHGGRSGEKRDLAAAARHASDAYPFFVRVLGEEFELNAVTAGTLRTITGDGNLVLNPKGCALEMRIGN